ncbi:MAG: hypothetical protein AAF687_00325 [Pseudomonadota bacterium]
MDTLRGNFDSKDSGDDSQDWDARDNPHNAASDSAQHDEGSRELPPAAIGQDERRMQVRAYNHWASLLGDLSFPSVEDLNPENLPDFGPNSVLLDFSVGIEDPVVQFLGEKLGEECGADGPIARLSDVPPRSLLSRITDHYMQIIANQAPIGFEAEFVNQRGASILYRGILLPFSSDDETIDFVFGVINWKEMADQATADELLLEIDQAIDGANREEPEATPHKHHTDPVTDWADSPLDDMPSGSDSENEDEETAESHGVSDPLVPDFGQFALDDGHDEEEDEDDGEPDYGFASLSDFIEAPAKKALDLDEVDLEPTDNGDAEPKVAPNDAPAAKPAELDADDDAPVDQDHQVHDDDGLYDCLASARELAHTARASEDRSRQALYAAVGRAYDVSLAAQDAPEDYAELIEENGLVVQDRAPMTPVVKLVFGSDYDKTRLTEYAAVLSHAHRKELSRGELAEFLGKADGGLKGVVAAERRLRREESGKQVEAVNEVREALKKKLRQLEAMTFEAVSPDGPEFSLVMVRRDGVGNVVVLGEIENDVPMVERAARKLVG